MFFIPDSTLTSIKSLQCTAKIKVFNGLYLPGHLGGLLGKGIEFECLPRICLWSLWFHRTLIVLSIQELTHISVRVKPPTKIQIAKFFFSWHTLTACQYSHLYHQRQNSTEIFLLSASLKVCSPFPPHDWISFHVQGWFIPNMRSYFFCTWSVQILHQNVCRLGPILLRS